MESASSIGIMKIVPIASRVHETCAVVSKSLCWSRTPDETTERRRNSLPEFRDCSTSDTIALPMSRLGSIPKPPSTFFSASSSRSLHFATQLRNILPARENSESYSTIQVVAETEEQDDARRQETTLSSLLGDRISESCSASSTLHISTSSSVFQ